MSLNDLRYYDLIVLEGSSDRSVKNAFDRALCDAGIADVNYIHISSILPPGLTRGCFRTHLRPGDFYFAAMAQTNDQTERLAHVGIGVLIPNDPHQSGLILECVSEQLLSEQDLSEGLTEMLAQRGRSIDDHQLLIGCSSGSTLTGRYGYRGCLVVFF